MSCYVNVPYGEVGPVATIQGLECIFKNIVRVTTEVAVLVLFVMILFGGFKYMTAGGDAKAAQSAKGTLTYAIGGVFLLVIIWLILKFIEIFTGAKVTIFDI